MSINDNNLKNISLFKSFFKGRDDVFAVRWEKGNKSGYMRRKYGRKNDKPPLFLVPEERQYCSKIYLRISK